jgi:ssDNA-binding Zn-finger/Zn-ribbon topoisomerase 1
MTDLAIVMCPPLSDYAEYPEDQSYSTLVDCPKCKQEMWLSSKKKGLLLFLACINKEILLACYHCIKKIAQDDPTLFTDSEKVKIQDIKI